MKAQGLRTVYECYDMDKMLFLHCEKDYDTSCKECEWRMRAFCSYEYPRKRQKRDTIRKGCLKLYEICRELDLQCHRMTWDADQDGIWNGDYKGIDDWLIAKLINRKNLAA